MRVRFRGWRLDIGAEEKRGEERRSRALERIGFEGMVASRGREDVASDANFDRHFLRGGGREREG